MNTNTVIFDLDGTLAIIDDRRQLATKNTGKLNWQVFFDPKNIALDKPNIPVIQTFKAMKAAGYRVGIFSGRDDVSFNETVEWLGKYEINFDFIRMRPRNSYLSDDVLKNNWLNEEIKNGHTIMCTFDDRDKAVRMWRNNNIPCFQVNYGDF